MQIGRWKTFWVVSKHHNQPHCHSDSKSNRCVNNMNLYYGPEILWHEGHVMIILANSIFIMIDNFSFSFKFKDRYLNISILLIEFPTSLPGVWKLLGTSWIWNRPKCVTPDRPPCHESPPPLSHVFTSISDNLILASVTFRFSIFE